MNQPVPLLKDEVIVLPDADEDQGFGALSTPKGLLPLVALDVHTRIDGLVARTVLTQTFVNALGEPLEATYIFPLPDRAAVTHFRMEVGGRIIEGILKERSQARQEYDRAIQEGRRAAIAEEERPGVFTLRVGNLMPAESATIKLTLCGPLSYSEGEATFRFPLVVARRYIPGTPLSGSSVGAGVVPDTDAVPDASRITPPVLLPGFPHPVRLSLSVELHAAGLPIRDVRSSLHAVRMDAAEGCQHIAVQPGARLDRDFILRFKVAENAIRTSLLLQPDIEGKETTFLLSLVPPVGAGATRPRDVVFVLDRSGSMTGWKMVAARRALARMVDTLSEHDRFTVLAFDDMIETPPACGEGLAPADNRRRFRAVEFLARVDARGGTEMAQPLDRAVNLLNQGADKRDRILVLVTDGQVGNEDQILGNLGKRLADLRVFTLGIDQAVNAGFLKRLASLGGGYCELVESEDRLDDVMDKIHRRIATPVLTDLRLEPVGLEIDRATLVPPRLPDLFAGTPLFLMGRCLGSAGKLQVKAKDSLGSVHSETAVAQVSANPAVTTLWARGQVRALEDRYLAGQEDRPSLEKRIVETSLRFGVLCRFTAFTAVDVKEVVNPGGQVQRVVQPVEPAAGWGMLGTEQQTLMAGAPGAKGMSMRAFRGPSDTGPPDTEAVVSYLAEFEDTSAPQAMSAPPSRSARGRSLLHSIFGSPAEQPAVPEQAIDLSPYQRRVQELLDRWQHVAQGTPEQWLGELGWLLTQLTSLIEDLKSVGVEPALFRPLADLHQEISELLKHGTPAVAEAQAISHKIEKVLQEFARAGMAGAAGPLRPNRPFWK